ncbi:MAG: hypothetical protein ACOVMF_06100 [Aquiluna sp.]
MSLALMMSMSLEQLLA